MNFVSILFTMQQQYSQYSACYPTWMNTNCLQTMHQKWTEMVLFGIVNLKHTWRSVSYVALSFESANPRRPSHRPRRPSISDLLPPAPTLGGRQRSPIASAGPRRPSAICCRQRRPSTAFSDLLSPAPTVGGLQRSPIASAGPRRPSAICCRQRRPSTAFSGRHSFFSSLAISSGRW